MRKVSNGSPGWAPIIAVAIVLLISPFMNWLNGYCFIWIF